jgi:ribonuclease VapC
VADAEPVVLDASAVLAFARNEPGADRVQQTLGTAVISAVNVAECLAVLSRFTTTHAAARALSRLGLTVISCDWETAVAAAELHAAVRERGLTLADCVCLATARRLGRRALTAERAWAGLEVSVPVEVLQ